MEHSFCLRWNRFFVPGKGKIMMTEKKMEVLQQRIGYRFQNPKLLIQAMSHSSYANEHWQEKGKDNERLEFLGDAVLEVASSEFLFLEYPKMPEGDMTKFRASIVCEPTLALCAREIGLPQFLLLGRGEEMTGGRNRNSIVSDAMEALIGAIYLDGGFASAKEFVLKFILNDMENKQLFFDSKTILQEIIQEDGTKSVQYELVKEEGPDHNKSFTVNVLIDGQVLGNGTGHTKKAAEQKAAYEAIQKLRQEL